MNLRTSVGLGRPERVPSAATTLRRLFLTLFLRGHAVRRFHRQNAPKSIGAKLATTLVFYLLFGGMALVLVGQPVFALAVYLHAMTFVFLGMFVASSAGEILFNKMEADILLHRPVSPEAMLWAKIRVLVEVSLWLAGAFNLVGLGVGIGTTGHWRFPLAHLCSTTLEALFCTGCVVLVYQMCLRWFGRERLEGLMTIAQVMVAVTAVLAGQLLPQVVLRAGRVLSVDETSAWIALLPPAWFAGVDDALAGSGRLGAWVLAALALILTALVLWLAFGRLAQDYTIGLQGLGETVSPRAAGGRRRRWLERLVHKPPLSWWLRDPVARVSFLLTAAYLARDRDVKLRVYPGIAPILVLPFIFLLQNQRHQAGGDFGFGVPFSGFYLGMVPLFGMQLLQYSQQWQAAEVFRAAPLAGPAALCQGARRAVVCLLALPVLLLVGLLVALLHGSLAPLVLFLPGVIALPVFALVPNLGGQGVPLSLPTEAAQSTRRGLKMMLVMFVAFSLAGVASVCWSHGWFWWFILAESLVCLPLYAVLRRMIARASWPADD